LIISARLKHPSKEPLVQIGGYLDAAAIAAAALKGNPSDLVAQADYNLSVSRIIEVIDDARLQPWKAALHCPGAQGERILAFNTDRQRGRNAADFQLRPVDRYEFKGRLIVEHTVKKGLGAPLVATSRGIDFTKNDQFAQGKQIYYGMTAMIDFDGRRCEASLFDPLSTETVEFDGRTYPLAANYTAPIALALAELHPRKKEIQRLFEPEEFRKSTRLARLQPYDAKKIPLLVIHGLGDSQATWAPMIETLRADATFRANYQVWFFSYPTGYPYPLMTAVLREQMDAMKARYPDHKPIVVLGHSMGGMIARALITDSGMNIWNAYFSTPPEQTGLSEESRQLMAKILIFRHQSSTDRVIFLSASLRGSDTATSLIGRLGARLIRGPSDLSEVSADVLAIVKPDADGRKIKRTPNSIEGLDPANRFLLAINSLPTAKGIPYHSIMGDRGKGGNLNRTPPMSTDGIVPYWSSHIDGAQSELIVPSHHWSNRNPIAIAEVLRILIAHLRHPEGTITTKSSVPTATASL
jgi:hypothetical protein